jgi:hypothetical protein
VTVYGFEELHLTAAFVCAPDHQRRTAGFAFFIYECLSFAGWAGDIERTSTARTYSIALYYLFMTSGTVIPKRAAACAFGAEPGVAFNEFTAMDAWLLISSHLSAFLTRTILTIKRIPR